MKNVLIITLIMDIKNIEYIVKYKLYNLNKDKYNNINKKLSN